MSSIIKFIEQHNKVRDARLVLAASYMTGKARPSKRMKRRRSFLSKLVHTHRQKAVEISRNMNPYQIRAINNHLTKRQGFSE